MWNSQHCKADCPVCRRPLQGKLVQVPMAILQFVEKEALQCNGCQLVATYDEMIKHHTLETLYKCDNGCNTQCTAVEMAVHLKRCSLVKRHRTNDSVFSGQPTYDQIRQTIVHQSNSLNSLILQLAPTGCEVAVIHANKKRELCKVLSQEHLTLVVYSHIVGGALSVSVFERRKLGFEPYLDWETVPRL